MRQKTEQEVDFSLPPQVLKRFLSRFTGNYYNLPWRTLELKRRRKEDKLWAYFLRKRIDREFIKELIGTILRNGNILLYIFAPRNHAKSEMAQTIALMIQELYSRVGIQVDIVFTRNYAETNRVLGELIELGRKAIIIQDEDESLQGEDKIRERDAQITLLDTNRILGISIITCSVTRDDALAPHITGSLEIVGMDFDARMDLLYAYDATNYPLGTFPIPLHRNEVMREDYKREKRQAQIQLAKQRGRRGAADADQVDIYAKKIYEETLETYPNMVLTKAHFNAVARRYSYITGINDAAGIAFSRWKTEDHVKEDRGNLSRGFAMAIPVEGRGFREWVVDNLNKAGRAEIAKIFDMSCKKIPQDDIATEINRSQFDVSRKISRFKEAELGAWGERYWREKVGDQREIRGRAQQGVPDAIGKDGKVYSVKTTLDKRGSMIFSLLDDDFRPEIEYSNGKFTIVLIAPLWESGETFTTEVDKDKDSEVKFKDEYIPA